MQPAYLIACCTSLGAAPDPEYGKRAIPLRKDAVKMDFLVAVDGIPEAELEARKQAALASQADAEDK